MVGGLGIGLRVSTGTRRAPRIGPVTLTPGASPVQTCRGPLDELARG